jgi:hypothetical protein
LPDDPPAGAQLPDELESALDRLVLRFGESMVIRALQARKWEGRLVRLTHGGRQLRTGRRGDHTINDHARLFEMARRLEQGSSIRPWNAAWVVAGSRRDSVFWNATWTVDASIDRPVRFTIAKRLFRKFREIGGLERCLYFICAMYALPTNVQAQSKMLQLINDYVTSRGKPLDQAEISDEFIHKLRLAAADGVFLDRQNISHKSPTMMVPPDAVVS